MIIYMNALYSNEYMPEQKNFVKLTETEQNIITTTNYLAETYQSISNKNITSLIRNHKFKIFLTSKATQISATMRNNAILAYAQFLNKNADLWLHDGNNILCSVLDEMSDPLQTFRNQKALENLGINTLPCYNLCNNDERFLDYYVNNYEYIIINGISGISSKHLIPLLDHIWNKYLLDNSGKVKLKIHAVGVASLDILKRYPWHSCDSSIFTQLSVNGNILTNNLDIVTISNNSSKIHTQGKHLSNLSHDEQERVFKYISAANFEHERLASSIESRTVFNLNMLKHLNKNFTYSDSSIFNGCNISLF